VRVDIDPVLFSLPLPFLAVSLLSSETNEILAAS